MATIQFVGPAPTVSDKGVRFDPNRPDSYIYMSAILQLVEAFDKKEGEVGGIVYHPHAAEFDKNKINSLLQKYCPDLDKRVGAKKEEVERLAEELRQRVESHPSVSADGRRAWLGNIDAMYDYYLQYVTNEVAYDCLLERLAQEVVNLRIEEIKVPLLNHFGMVLNHLAERLDQGKPPVGSDFQVEQTQEGLVAVIKLRHA